MGRRRGGGGNPDVNQTPLVQLARRLGASVQITSQIGGWVDATLGFRGLNLLWEIKKPGWAAAVARGKKLTDTERGQEELRSRWRGRITVIETAEDVVQALLEADANRNADYINVSDDFLAVVVRAVRSNPLMSKGTEW